MSPPNSSAAICTSGLTKHFGDTVALEDLDLEVASGCVFGFLGPNGAGKSTTIRMLLGLIRPTAGSASVLGLDPVGQRTEVHRRVGYLPGDFAAYNDMTGERYLRFLADLRGDVDDDHVGVLAERFEVDLHRAIGALSHGNRQKVGLIQAMMHRPDLLILDEPTQGLDPLMQRVFLELLAEQRDAGRTVFLSSHVLAEVEEAADRVAIIRRGRLATVSDINDLKARTRRRVELRFTEGSQPSQAQLGAIDGVVRVAPLGAAVEVVVEGSMAELLRVAAPFGIERMVSNEVDLEGVFLQYYEDEAHERKEQT
ncbi:MAG: ABC transporter ATP-binding protein [Microthrixaceae bacterium]